MTVVARDYQIELVGAAWAEICQAPTALAVLPTGGGKTVCIAELMRKSMAVKHNIRIMMLMGRVDLVKQNEQALARVLDRRQIGVYCGSLKRRELSRPITVASIQSIGDIQMPFVDLLVVDEVHNLDEDQDDGRYLKFIEKAQAKNPNLKIVGFTATPFRSKGLIYGEKMLFKKIAYRKSIKEMIAMGYLCEPKLKGSAHAFDVSRLRLRAGDYRQEDVNELVSNKDIVHEQVADALGRMDGRVSCVWACANIEHCNLVANELMQLGERVTTVHSKLNSDARAQNLGAFIGGAIRHMSFVSILSEGFDHPPIDCVVLMRPTRSPVLYVQTCGRGLRPYPGKEDCLVLDYGQVVKTLGPLDEPNVKNKKSESGEAPVKECPDCFTFVFAGVRSCPECGFAFPEPKPTIEKLDRKADSETEILSKALKPETKINNFAFLAMHESKNGNLCVKITYATHDVKSPWGAHFGDTEFFVTTSPWAMERLERRLTDLDVDLPGIPFEDEICVPGTFEVVKTKDGAYDRILSVKRTAAPEPVLVKDDTSFDFGFNEPRANSPMDIGF